MRSVRWACRLALVVVVLAGCSHAPTVATDASGLTVISETRDQVVAEQLRDAYAAYDLLTETYPDDFGYASPDVENLTVRVGVVTGQGRALLAAFALGKPLSQPSPLGGDAEGDAKRQVSLTSVAEQAMGLRAAAVETRHSRRETEALKDDLIGWAVDARFAGAAIWMSEVERSTGMVVLGVEQLTPALAHALVARYGTDRLVVRVAERPEAEVTAQ